MRPILTFLTCLIVTPLFCSISDASNGPDDDAIGSARDEACEALLREYEPFTYTEQQTWDVFCSSTINQTILGRNLEVESSDDACNPSDLVRPIPVDRGLRADLLRSLVTNTALVNVLPQRSLTILCAHIIDYLDLTSADLDLQIRINGSYFDSGIGLAGARLGQVFMLNVSTIDGQLYASQLEIDGALELDGSNFNGDVFLDNAELRGGLRAGGADFAGILSLMGAEIGSGIYLFEANISGYLNVSNASVAGNLDLWRSTVGGALYGRQLQVERSLYLNGGANFGGYVDLLDAQIGLTLSATSSTFESALRLEGITTGGSVFLRNGAVFHGSVRITYADIGRNLEVGSAQFRSDLNCRSCTIQKNLFLNDQSVFMAGVHFGHAQILGYVDAGGSWFDGPVNFDASSVGESVNLGRGALFRELVSFNGAHIGTWFQSSRSSFNSGLVLANADIEHSLRIGDYSVYKSIDLRSINVGLSISAESMYVYESLEADSVATGRSFFIRNGTLIGGRVNLINGAISGSLEFSNSTIEGVVNAHRIQVGQALFLESADFLDGIYLSQASIGSSIFGSRAVFHQGLVAIGIHVGADIILTENADFSERLNLIGAKVDGRIDLSGSNFHGEVDLDDIQVGRSLRLADGAHFHQRLDLLNARIDRNVTATGSQFDGDIDADGIFVGEAFLLRGGSTFNGVLDLIFAHINTLQFGASNFNNHVNLTQTLIEAELLMSSPSEWHGVPVWGEEASITLRNVSVQTLQADMEAWQRRDGSWVNVDLNGFEYERMGGLNAAMQGESVNMASAPAGDLVAWIQQSRSTGSQLYQPQPYQQLSDALYRAGATDAAEQIRFAQLEHRRTADSTSFIDKLLLWISMVFVGHGTRPFLPLAWLGGLWLAGIAVAFRSKAVELRPVSAKTWYSLENALPLVELNALHKNLEHGDVWAENFFHAQKVAGFALATMLVGALTVLSG